MQSAESEAAVAAVAAVSGPEPRDSNLRIVPSADLPRLVSLTDLVCFAAPRGHAPVHALHFSSSRSPRRPSSSLLFISIEEIYSRSAAESRRIPGYPHPRVLAGRLTSSASLDLPMIERRTAIFMALPAGWPACVASLVLSVRLPGTGRGETATGISISRSPFFRGPAYIFMASLPPHDPWQC